MWPLLICSVLSLAITMDRFFFLWKWKRSMDLNSPHNIMSRIEKAALSSPESSLRDYMEIAAQEEIDQLKKGLNILDTIITMAPLLGILGTVVGIIESFQLLGDVGIETPKAVIGGISKALITTATGLSIALVTLVPFNFLTGKVQKAVLQLNKIVLQLEASIQAKSR